MINVLTALYNKAIFVKIERNNLPRQSKGLALLTQCSINPADIELLGCIIQTRERLQQKLFSVYKRKGMVIPFLLLIGAELAMEVDLISFDDLSK